MVGGVRFQIKWREVSTAEKSNWTLLWRLKIPTLRPQMNNFNQLVCKWDLNDETTRFTTDGVNATKKNFVSAINVHSFNYQIDRKAFIIMHDKVQSTVLFYIN